MKPIAAVRRLFVVGGLLVCLLPGCALFRPRVDLALHSQAPSSSPTPPSSDYVVCCPDVLELRIQGAPELSGRRAVGPDGRIQLGQERILVDGLNVPSIALTIAHALSLAPQWVEVDIAEYQSQQVYLVGQVVGLQRAVPYQGPETVVNLLRRAGGITAGAAPDHIYVVRANLIENKAPEVFHVNLRKIVMENDPRTNVIVHPGDEIFVNETWECSLLRSMPPWLRPIYESFWGMRQSGERQVAQGTR